jgi:hypothetical protein
MEDLSLSSHVSHRGGSEGRRQGDRKVHSADVAERWLPRVRFVPLADRLPARSHLRSVRLDLIDSWSSRAFLNLCHLAPEITHLAFARWSVVSRWNGFTPNIRSLTRLQCLTGDWNCGEHHEPSARDILTARPTP